MTGSSSDSHESARKIQALWFQAIARVGQNVIADAIGVSAPTVSRFCSEPEHLERACKVLAAAGLKVVPRSAECVSNRTMQAWQHVDPDGFHCDE
jgi:hypothetical protein